jgi:membrane protease YdiL (CAAX protease family)
VYTLLVSLGEEVLFRGVLFGLAKQSFSKKLARRIQAFVFSAIHFTGLSYLFVHFSSGNSLPVTIITMVVYFISLYFFAILASRFVRTKNPNNDKEFDLLMPIIFHLRWILPSRILI